MHEEHTHTMELTNAEMPDELKRALYILCKLCDKGMSRIEAQAKNGKLYVVEVTVAE